MLTRRDFVQTAATAATVASTVSLPAAQAAVQEKTKRKTMAIVSTEWRYHSHAQHMGDRPRYVHGPFDPDDYRNVPDIHTLPVGSAAHREHWPDLEYAKPVPCIARAGQVTVINQAAIHSASTNRGTTARKTFIITFRPQNVVIGEKKTRFERRRQYSGDLKNQLSPDRRYFIPDDV